MVIDVCYFIFFSFILFVFYFILFSIFFLLVIFILLYLVILFFVCRTGYSSHEMEMLRSAFNVSDPGVVSKLNANRQEAVTRSKKPTVPTSSKKVGVDLG
jgi:hypothetical protein